MTRRSITPQSKFPEMRRRSSLRKRLSTASKPQCYCLALSPLGADDDDNGRQWTTLRLPVTLGRKILVETFWRSCPNQECQKRLNLGQRPKQGSCVHCNPMLKAKNVCSLSREMIFVKLNGTLTFYARHEELVNFVPHPTNSQKTAGPKILGVLSIGTNKEDNPWMKFELKLVRYMDDDDDDDGNDSDDTSLCEDEKNPPAAKSKASSRQARIPPHRERKQVETPKRSNRSSTMWYHKETNDGISRKRRRESDLFGSPPRRRRRLLTEFSESSEDDEPNRVFGDNNSLLEESPARRQLDFSEREMSPARRQLSFQEREDKSTQESFSRPRLPAEVEQRAVDSSKKIQPCQNLPPNQATPGAKVSKRIVTPEENNDTALPVSQTKRRASQQSADTDSFDGTRPLSQAASLKATSKNPILSMPDDQSTTSSNDEASAVPQRVVLDEVATQVPADHATGTKTTNPVDLTLEDWKSIASAHGEKSFRGCVARLVLTRNNREGSLRLPPLFLNDDDKI